MASMEPLRRPIYELNFNSIEFCNSRSECRAAARAEFSSTCSWTKLRFWRSVLCRTAAPRRQIAADCGGSQRQTQEPGLKPKQASNLLLLTTLCTSYSSQSALNCRGKGAEEPKKASLLTLLVTIKTRTRWLTALIWIFPPKFPGVRNFFVIVIGVSVLRKINQNQSNSLQIKNQSTNQ